MGTLLKVFKENFHISSIPHRVINIFYLGFSYLYGKYLLVSIQGLDLKYSVIALVLLITIFFMLSEQFYVVKNEWINSIIFLIIPYGIFTYLSYFSFRPSLFILLGIGAVFASGAVTYALIQVINVPRYNRNILFSVTTVLIGFLSLILILAIAINSALYHHGYFDTIKKVEENAVKIEDLAYLKDKKMSEVSFEEKVEIATKIMNIEKEYLGVSRNISLVIINERNPDNVGSYIENIQELHLSEVFFNSDYSFYELINTIAHEMYHCYEYELCDIYARLDDDQKQLLLFEKIGEYDKNIKNYVTYEEDAMDYYRQSLEEDAYDYGEKRADVYKIIWETTKNK